MNRHLTDEQLLDIVEGHASGTGHLETCAACAERVRFAREAMAVLQEDRVPEPSPLFWTHFSRRVAQTIEADATSQIAHWSVSRWMWPVAGAAAAIVLVLAAPLMRAPVGEPENARVALTASSPTTVPDPGTFDLAADVSWALARTDESWQAVEDLTGDVDVETASSAGIFVRPGSIDREVLMLSDQERQDLAKIVQAELDRSRL